MGKAVKSVARVVVSPLSLIDKDLGRLGLQAVALVAPFIPGGQIVAAIAAISLATLYNSKPKAGGPDSLASSPTIFRQAISNVQIVYAQCRVGGLLSFWHAKKVGDDHFRYFIITFAGHQCEGVTKYWLNDEEVTVDGTGLVTSGKYANAAWIWPELGSATATANATFVAECEGKWTTDHRGRGIAKLYAKFKLTDEVIAEGLPNITCEVQGKNDIYDPRDESTGYTNNAILCIYDWLKLAREDGGFGIDADEADDDFISAQANICDEPVPLAAGGTEARYTCDGLITAGAAPDEIRDKLLTCCAGEFTYSGGMFKVYAGAFRTVNGAPLLEDDLAGNIAVSPLSAGDTIANEIRGTFLDPRQKYQPVEYPSLALTTTDDLRTIDLDLPFTKSHTRCQRIAKIMLHRASAERSVTWPMNLKGLAVEALDNVQLATSRYGLSNYTWKAYGWGLNEDFSVGLQLREEAPEFYDWSVADEQASPLPAETITTPAGIDIPSSDQLGTLTLDGGDASTEVP